MEAIGREWGRLYIAFSCADDSNIGGRRLLASSGFLESRKK